MLTRYTFNVGKRVGSDLYLHISAIEALSGDDARRVANAFKSLPIGFKPVILTIRPHGIRFTECADWDTVYEPTVGDSVTVYPDGNTKLIKACKGNPLIYHRRHLFVLPDYNGFDLADDRKRVADWMKYNPSTLHMGRKLWWSDFCQTHGLLTK